MHFERCTKDMNRTVWLIIIVLVIVSVVCTVNYDFTSEKGNEIYVLILEGTISGLVTLGGLVFTFYKQEQISRCPCFVIEQKHLATTRVEYSYLDKRYSIVCCDENTEFVRKVTVDVRNAKDAWALNFTVNGIKQGSLQGLKSSEKTLILPDRNNSENIGEITITFQDSYGKQYYQIVEFCQRDTEYVFTSRQPKLGER